MTPYSNLMFLKFYDLSKIFCVGNVNFPKTYPSGCLLGFVTVVDVVPQEEFQNLEMIDDNDSPYLFLCGSFFELPLKYPIKGKHKICKSK